MLQVGFIRSLGVRSAVVTELSIGYLRSCLLLRKTNAFSGAAFDVSSLPPMTTMLLNAYFSLSRMGNDNLMNLWYNSMTVVVIPTGSALVSEDEDTGNSYSKNGRHG